MSRSLVGRATPFLAAFAAACTSSATTVSGPDPLALPRVQAFADTVEQRTFGYFWALSNPVTGLTPDRWPTQSFSSIAAVGFALTAYPIGVEHGYVTRAEARQRTLATLRFFWNARQDSAATGATGYHGFFYHFLDPQTGARFQTVELSTIDTSLLLAGALFCREYFDQADPDELAIRAYADSLYERVDWQWAFRPSSHLAGGWTPEAGFPNYEWRGLNEAMILYLLALGSPTHPVPAAAWDAWTSSYQWGNYYGESHVGFAPLFGHQYSQIWVDFRGIRDAYMRGRGIDYFENSRRATYAQRDYARANPAGWTGYDTLNWGLTASDGPADVTLLIGGRSRLFFTYAARGADFTEVRDDGTIAPTGAGGSIPFAPEITLPTLLAMRERFDTNLFSTYGFLDAYNLAFPPGTPLHHGHLIPSVGWFDTDYLGIDQGPLLAMLENCRSDLVWRYMRRSPAIIRGLRRAGFTGGWIDAAP